MSKNGKTISFHNGSTYSRGHNIRDKRFIKNMENIDSSLTEKNIVYRDIPVRQAYEEIFKKAVDEYNMKQKRADRRITDYYEKIKEDKRKHTVYECIVQIGDKDDTGYNAEKEKQALLEYVKEWDSRNPNLKLIGAYIHADEPEGTVHLHCDYIPIAHCTRGMSLQNSLDRALKEQGIHSDSFKVTAQISWQDKERDILKEICKKYSIDIDEERTPESVQHYDTPIYKRMKDQMREEIKKELEPEIAELNDYIELNVTTEDISDRFTVKKTLFKEDQIVGSGADFEILKEQAKAYRINKNRIESLDEREKRIEKKEYEIALLKKVAEREAWEIVTKARIKANFLTGDLVEREQELDKREQEIDNEIEEAIEDKVEWLDYQTIKQEELYEYYTERIAELDRKKEYYEAKNDEYAKKSVIHELTNLENQSLKIENELLKAENTKLKGIVESLKKMLQKWAVGLSNILNTVMKGYKFDNTPKDLRMLYESTLDYGFNIINNDELPDSMIEKLKSDINQQESPKEILNILAEKGEEKYKKQHPESQEQDEDDDYIDHSI